MELIYLKPIPEPLNGKIRILFWGTIRDPCIILGTALKVAATSMIIAHNHPSGQLKPSLADERLTTKIKEGARFMDINLADHIILSSTDDMYYSFADEGYL